jgi:hypothetical protein
VVDLRVKAFTNVRVSDDGLTISVRALTPDGQAHQMTMSYDELDWVTGALMAAGAGAYDRQIASGKLGRGNPVDPGMTVDDFRAMPSPSLQHVLVQLIGRQSAEGPLVLDSFVIDEERCRGLGRHLIESADQLAQQMSNQS